MRRWPRRRGIPWSGAAAALVLVVIAFFFLAWTGLGGGEGGIAEGPEMTRSEFRSLTVGASRDDVERSVGKGEGALDFNQLGGASGAALEPMNATCVYYALPGGYGVRGPIQLCYREDELISKQIYS